jgi:hypothetical protein
MDGCDPFERRESTLLVGPSKLRNLLCKVPSFVEAEID